MPDNGSGVYTVPSGSAATANTTIESSVYNALLDDLASALSSRINADGQKPYAANQPMAAHKFTGLAAGSSAGDSVRYEQSPDGIFTTRGDLLRRGASAAERVALGTSGQFLTSDGTDPVWSTVTGADIIDDGSGNLTFSSVPLYKSSSYTILAADRNKRIIYNDITGTAATFTLPAPASGLQYGIGVLYSSGGTLTVEVANTGTQIILDRANNGATSITLNPGEFMLISSDSGNWTTNRVPAASTTRSGIVEKATQTETNNGTAGKFPDAAAAAAAVYVAKAWVACDASGNVESSYNVSSVSVTGTGSRTINFVNSIGSTNYSPVGSGSGGSGVFNYGTRNLTSCNITLTSSTTAGSVNIAFSAHIMGS